MDGRVLESVTSARCSAGGGRRERKTKIGTAR